MQRTDDALSGDLAGSYGIQGPFKDLALGVGNAHDQLALVFEMAPAQSNRSLSIDESGQVGGVHSG